MSTSDGGGYCDCGDSEAFLKDAICDNHLKLSLNKPPKEDILKKYPEGLADRTKMILMQVCLLYNQTRYSHDLNTRHSIYVSNRITYLK